MDMTGQVSADFIKTGELIANNGVYELDMSTGYVKMSQGEFAGQLKAATGTITDGTGTMSLSGGDLNMSNSNSGGAGVFARRSDGAYYACWGAKNSAAMSNGSYLEVPTYVIMEMAQHYIDEGPWYNS